MTIGIILSLIGTFFHVTFMVPRRFCTFDVKYYYISLSFGTFLSSVFTLCCYSLFNRAFSLAISRTMILTGIILGITWVIGFFTYMQGIELIGLSRATALKNYTAVIGLLIGILGFGELRQMGPFELGLVFVGCLMMLGSGVALARTLPGEIEDFTRKRDGIFCSLVAVVFFAIYATEVKLVVPRIMAVEYIPVATAWGGALATLVFLYITKGKKGVGNWLRMPVIEHLRALGGGFLWVIGMYCMTVGIQMAGVGISWAVTPFGTVFSVVLGLKVFHEIELRHHRKYILSGILSSLAAVILFLFAIR
ncbi:MAG: GRP family sugar transporter [Bacteroidota bacterium]